MLIKMLIIRCFAFNGLYNQRNHFYFVCFVCVVVVVAAHAIRMFANVMVLLHLYCFRQRYQWIHGNCGYIGTTMCWDRPRLLLAWIIWGEANNIKYFEVFAAREKKPIIWLIGLRLPRTNMIQRYWDTTVRIYYDGDTSIILRYYGTKILSWYHTKLDEIPRISMNVQCNLFTNANVLTQTEWNLNAFGAQKDMKIDFQQQNHLIHS